ncbi:MAG: cation diffusion facilitator family transporter [Burkholderiales bacterium]|nr:cation diffusion facilitator family transporter [Burkholderiales bacterium]
MAGGANPTKAVLYALGANFAIAVTKYVAAAMTGSSAMLAEAVHSTADCGNQLLLLLGLKRSKRPPTADYPLGFGKETYFWSFVVAIILFSVGGMFSMYEGWHKLHEPQMLEKPMIALGVLAFGIAAESFSMWGAMREVNKSRGKAGLWYWFRHTRNSELVVIFGEDLAALLGLAFAFIAVGVTWMTGNPLYDAIGTLAIGVLLVVVAILVAIEVKAMLIGQGVESSVRAEMLEFLGAQPAVEKVIDLLTLHMGGDVMVAVKAKLRPQGDLDRLVEAINDVEARFKERFPETQWIFFEPDVR